MARQAWVTDVSRFFRTGGIDWDSLAAWFDAVGIMGWIGDFVDPLYFEHVEAAEARDLDWFSIHIPKPGFPLQSALDQIFDLPGVGSHPICFDLEPTDGLMVNEYEARKFHEGLSLRWGALAWFYSNYNYTSKIGFPAWIKPLVKYWAEYPFDIVTKYRKVERYLDKNPWSIPKWAIKAGYTPEMHQFSDYGDAQFYYANAQTDDPDFPAGKKGADLGVSLIDADELKLLFHPEEENGALEERVFALETQMVVTNGRIFDLEGQVSSIDGRVSSLHGRVSSLEDRVSALEEGDSGAYITLKAKERFPLGIIVGHDAACDGFIPPGKPVIEHPDPADRIFVEAGSEVRAFAAVAYSCKDDASTPIIYAAGRVPYYVAVDGYPGQLSLIRADLVDLI